MVVVLKRLHLRKYRNRVKKLKEQLKDLDLLINNGTLENHLTLIQRKEFILEIIKRYKLSMRLIIINLEILSRI